MNELDKKYAFTGEKRFQLKQIIALRDFGDVKTNDIGGWIESEDNLSHKGNCWVYENAKIYENAKVFGNAEVLGNAQLLGNAQVFGNARVYGHVWVSGNAKAYGNAEVYGNARVYKDACVYENAKVSEDAKVSENAEVYGNAKVYGDARVRGNTKVYGDAEVYENAMLYESAKVYGEACINSCCDDFRYFSFMVGRPVTALLIDGDWTFNIGCQKLLTKDEFIDRIYNKDGGVENNPHRKNYLDILKMCD